MFAISFLGLGPVKMTFKEKLFLTLSSKQCDQNKKQPNVSRKLPKKKVFTQIVTYFQISPKLNRQLGYFCKNAFQKQPNLVTLVVGAFPLPLSCSVFIYCLTFIDGFLSQPMFTIASIESKIHSSFQLERNYYSNGFFFCNNALNNSPIPIYYLFNIRFSRLKNATISICFITYQIHQVYVTTVTG